MSLTRKALNYDFDDNLLKRYYPNPKSYKNAWKNVKQFLYHKGFENRQYSGVVSIKPMRSLVAQDAIQELNNYYKWLGPCVLRFDITSVELVYSLKNIFDSEENY